MAADSEVVSLLRDLLRFDTSNPPGNEKPCAEHLASLFRAAGIATEMVETAPNRSCVIARVKGTGAKPPLLLSAHLDVVPAGEPDWKHPPFAGEIHDGYVWGRGAVDMKDFDAMLLSVVRARANAGVAPDREVVLCFTADEEAGGGHGAKLLVEEHADLLADCTEAVGEVGGFSATVRGRRVYLIEAAEKGMAWMRLSAHGRAGHGSMINDDNAVTRLAGAVARIGAHQWPVRLTPTMEVLLATIGELAGTEATPENAEALVEEFGDAARMLGAVIRNTANPTMLKAGYKHNVIPQTAEAFIDCRFLPGYEDEMLATIDELIGPDVRREAVIQDIAYETTFDGDLVDAMVGALLAEDPGARAVPYCLSGGTDQKSFSLLGIRGFGFAPLRLPADLDFSGMFHGVDERVPLESLKFGVRVLDRFLSAS